LAYTTCLHVVTADNRLAIRHEEQQKYRTLIIISAATLYNSAAALTPVAVNKSTVCRLAVH